MSVNGMMMMTRNWILIVKGNLSVAEQWMPVAIWMMVVNGTMVVNWMTIVNEMMLVNWMIVVN